MGGNHGQAMAHQIFANNSANSAMASAEGMHVFVNSSGGGLAVNGGKFVAASEKYL